MKPLGANDPTSVASYRLLGVLGGGGMGRVYLGESRTGRRVAIKIIRAELAEDSVFRRRFEREVTIARTVSPLYTAAVVDADTTATQPWLATTYINGPSLSKLVAEQGPLAPGPVLTLAAGLAEALASIHAVGLVHRDLKPGNVIVDDSGPHIIDFGIALTAESTRMTASLMLGTPSYVAPEVIRGEEPGPPGDVFALGATLVFAASGKHLITDGTMHAQMLQITAGRFDLSAVPKELRPLIVRCTSANAYDRPTADELARILVASGVAVPAPGWYASTAPAPSIELPPVPSRRLSRRNMLVFGGLAGAAVLGTGAATWTGVFADRPLRIAATAPQVTGSARLPTSAAARTGPPGPGAILWQARSGATPVAPSPSARQSPARIIVDRGERIIAANGSRVFAVGINGEPLWEHPLPTGLVNLWPWGDAVLVSDPRRLWLLDTRTGQQHFAIDVAGIEEKDSRGDNPDKHPVEIGGVAVAGNTAFVGLGTATIALNRAGKRLWRRARPDARLGVRPPSGVPVATLGRWLVTHDPNGPLVDLGLRNVSDGKLQWLVQYEPAPTTVAVPPPPPGPPGGPSATPGPAGPGIDEAWTRSEGRIGPAHVIIREVQEVRVVALATGQTVWRQISLMPIAGIELVGGLVLVAADRLRAYAVADGNGQWDADQRGARVAIAPDGHSIVVASDQGLSSLDLHGKTLWHQPFPDAVQNTIADRITVERDVAYVTFRPRDDQSEPLAVDVIGVALTAPSASPGG